ncbi:MAG: restriction endonuclease subunit S [Verrucomicrobia bacterium]|nr:restriction endonuclease subunit S [Verrucomicrobiota bacterium]MCH8510855.1 restriction endonuclease subunit S [Kiritimatiellia bacterium]
MKNFGYRKLGEIFEFQNGRAFNSKLWSTSGLPIIRIQNLNRLNAPFNYYQGRYDPKDLVQPGDLLFSWSGTIGSSFGPHIWDRETGILNQHIFKVYYDDKVIWKKYAFYALNEITAEIEKSVNGSVGLVHITKKKLHEFVIPLPPILEQKRIVRILDEAFAGIDTAKANAEKNLQNARAIFDSHLESVLRSKKWKWKTLGDLCEKVEYGSAAKSKKEGKIPVLRMGNIKDGRLDWGNLVYTDNKAEIKKYQLKYNDVLFNRTNSPELVGKTAIYKNEMPAIFAGYLIRIHRKEDLLDADYLTYFLNSQIAFDYGKTVVISSVNQANINGTKLKGYPIPTPSLSEQKAIVAKLDALSAEIQRLAAIYERKLAALEALKKSLLHRAFAGEL